MSKAKQNFKKEIQEFTQLELKKTKEKVSKYMESAMLSLLGFEKRGYDNVEIDHCNGRNSVLIDAFRELAIDEARKLASGWKPTKEDWNLYKNTFEKEIRSQFNYVIRDMAKQKAIDIANKVLEDVKVDVDSLLNEQFGNKK